MKEGFEILDVFPQMLWNAGKYFWLHIPHSIYIWKFLPKLGQTGNRALCPFCVIENTISKVR
jgi:hypothetical protein